MLSVAVPFMLLSWAQQFVTSGFTGVSMAAVALIVLPLAHVFVPGERMTLRRTIGFVIGFHRCAGADRPRRLSKLGKSLWKWPWAGWPALARHRCYADLVHRHAPPAAD